ncbi:MAG: V-type ATP synthase subunit E [Eubacteriales bacterium]|nr:V-type ATP synthase subunit E [Eubacteriales bacterium]
MNAAAILDKIEQDALATAAQTLDDAQKKAEALKAASREKIEEMHRAMISQAERDSEALVLRMRRMAELNDRKELLSKKRALIDEAFAMAAEKMAGAPAEEKRAFFTRQIAANAAGNETLTIGAVAADWFDDAFLTEVNAVLLKAGKPGELKLAPGKCEGCAGVILAQHGAEIRCTFEALLEEMRAGLEQQAAVTLFGAPSKDA